MTPGRDPGEANRVEKLVDPSQIRRSDEQVDIIALLMRRLRTKKAPADVVAVKCLEDGIKSDGPADAHMIAGSVKPSEP
jgi:hypothetical protein